MFELANVLRPYAWGSPTAIADLLGTPPSGGPEAELWLGAHPDSPSVALHHDGTQVRLDDVIATDPAAMLGAESRAAFGDTLPFLAKVLAAESPLSLQVHPTQVQAQTAFAQEEAAGVPRDAEHRNYKDANHKPEMIFALTAFEALCGFRPCSQSADLFRQVAEAIEAGGGQTPLLLTALLSTLNSRMVEAEVLRRAFVLLIDGGEQARELVTTAAAALAAAAQADLPLELRTAVELDRQYPGDPGVLISLLLNRVSLKPGQCMYLPAGNIHAYLSGLGIEVMASSDNVLRGGLTPKHVDVPELLATVDFQALPVPFLDAVSTDLGQQLWTPPFAEFQLQRVELAPGGQPVPLAQNGPLLVIAVAGSALLDSPVGDLVLERGHSAFVPASEKPVMAHPHVGSAGTDTANAVLFAVTVATPAGQP